MTRPQVVGSEPASLHSGHQKLITAPFAEFTGDKSTASWLLNADYAKDWQQFQSTGMIQPSNSKP